MTDVHDLQYAVRGGTITDGPASGEGVKMPDTEGTT